MSEKQPKFFFKENPVTGQRTSLEKISMAASSISAEFPQIRNI